VTSASFKNRALHKKSHYVICSNHYSDENDGVLPLDVQDRVAEHLREYIDDLQDEIRWSESFQRTQQNLSLLQDVQNKKLLKG